MFAGLNMSLFTLSGKKTHVRFVVAHQPNSGDISHPGSIAGNSEADMRPAVFIRHNALLFIASKSALSTLLGIVGSIGR
tara:strand:+ start:800 stop:1036 length:237 start_codon:yes stop_codon:yes gene_type:complete